MQPIFKDTLDIYTNLEKYLSGGPKTTVGENIKKLAKQINEKNTKDTIESIVKLMDISVPMHRNHKSIKKFKRSAEEIIQDGSRTGCCDSSTLFVSLCRAKGIPAVQIITLNEQALKDGNYLNGHFFAGCYIKEENLWKWLNPDTNETTLNKDGTWRVEKKLQLHTFNPNSAYLHPNYLILAIIRDYSEYEFNGIKIDSIENIGKIHKAIYTTYIKTNIVGSKRNDDDER